VGVASVGMVLYSERRELQRIAEAEAEGASFWTPRFSDRARGRLLRQIQHFFSDSDPRVEALFERARALILDYLGTSVLVRGVYPAADFVDWWFEVDDRDFPTALEAIDQIVTSWLLTAEIEGFRRIVNDVMSRERISFDLIDGHMIPKESQVLHQEIVEPTLRLLHGLPGWDDVEVRYRKALEEISRQDPGDAITDAGSALELALDHVGATGNALGPKIKSARSKGLIAPYDEKLGDGIASFLHWASAHRSEAGDAHPSGDPVLADAWLAVHVVGALILRLAEVTPASDS
jgi:hypothetical protein